jgi:hypothetical protein
MKGIAARRTTLAAAFVLAVSMLPAHADAEGDASIALERQRARPPPRTTRRFRSGSTKTTSKGVTAWGFQADKATLMEVFKRDDPNWNMKGAAETAAPWSHPLLRIFGVSSCVRERLIAAPTDCGS